MLFSHTHESLLLCGDNPTWVQSWKNMENKMTKAECIYCPPPIRRGILPDLRNKHPSFSHCVSVLCCVSDRLGGLPRANASVSAQRKRQQGMHFVHVVYYSLLFSSLFGHLSLCGAICWSFSLSLSLSSRQSVLITFDSCSGSTPLISTCVAHLPLDRSVLTS